MKCSIDMPCSALDCGSYSAFSTFLADIRWMFLPGYSLLLYMGQMCNILYDLRYSWSIVVCANAKYRLISGAYCSCIQNTPILFCNPPYFIKFIRNWMLQQKSGLYLLSMADNLNRHGGWEKMHGKKIHSVKVNSECWNKESFFAHCYVSSMMHDLTLDTDSWVVALHGVGGPEECVPPWWFLMDENKYWFLSCKVLENDASNLCMEEQESQELILCWKTQRLRH